MKQNDFDNTIPRLFLWFYDQFQWRHLNMADQTKAKELKSRWQMLSLIPIPQWIKFSFFGRSGCPRLWQYGLWSFQMGDTKLESFLPKNQHAQRKFLNFEFWINVELSKSAKI